VSSCNRLNHISGIQDSLHFKMSCLQTSTVMHLRDNYFFCAENPILHANCTEGLHIDLYSGAY